MARGNHINAASVMKMTSAIILSVIMRKAVSKVKISGWPSCINGNVKYLNRPAA
jgi:hypothetical protein